MHLSIRLKNYTRLSDDLINQYFNKDEIIEMKTEAGDILFEDTSGLHKGQRLKKGNRLTLVFQYSSCLFGSVPKKIHFPPPLKESPFKILYKFAGMGQK